MLGFYEKVIYATGVPTLLGVLGYWVYKSEQEKKNSKLNSNTISIYKSHKFLT